jgi:hypothetical protein
MESHVGVLGNHHDVRRQTIRVLVGQPLAEIHLDMMDSFGEGLAVPVKPFDGLMRIIAPSLVGPSAHQVAMQFVSRRLSGRTDHGSAVLDPVSVIEQ